MRGKNLNVAPGEADEVRLELSGGIANRPDPLGIGKERQIKDTLPHVRLTPMNKVSEIGHTNGVDLLAWEKNVEDRFHSLTYWLIAYG